MTSYVGCVRIRKEFLRIVHFVRITLIPSRLLPTEAGFGSATVSYLHICLVTLQIQKSWARLATAVAFVVMRFFLSSKGLRTQSMRITATLTSSPKLNSHAGQWIGDGSNSTQTFISNKPPQLLR